MEFDNFDSRPGKSWNFDPCDDVDNGLDNTCEVIRQETVLFSTPETDYVIYD